MVTVLLFLRTYEGYYDLLGIYTGADLATAANNAKAAARTYFTQPGNWPKAAGGFEESLCYIIASAGNIVNKPARRLSSALNANPPTEYPLRLDITNGVATVTEA